MAENEAQKKWFVQFDELSPGFAVRGIANPLDKSGMGIELRHHARAKTLGSLRARAASPISSKIVHFTTSDTRVTLVDLFLHPRYPGVCRVLIRRR